MNEPTYELYSDYREYAPPDMIERARRFYDMMRRRRTVRAFSPRPIPQEVVVSALLAAGTAPSGANLQPWHFSVIADADAKRRIREAAQIEERAFYNGRASPEWLAALALLGTDADKPFLETASVLIAIFAQRHGALPDGRKIKHYYVPESVGIATGFLIAALHNAGVATLTHTPSPMGFLNEICGRPDSEKPYILLAAGYPEAECKIPHHGGLKKQLAEFTNWI